MIRPETIEPFFPKKILKSHIVRMTRSETIEPFFQKKILKYFGKYSFIFFLKNKKGEKEKRFRDENS